MENSIGYSIKKLHLATRQLLDRTLAPYGLSQAQNEIIYYLLQHNALTQAELSRKLKVAAPTITKMIDGLIEKDFVARINDELGTKRKQIALTAKGTKFKDEIATAQQQVEATLRQGFTKAELQALHAYIRRLYDNVHQKPPLR